MLWNIMVKVAPYTFGIYLIHDHLMVRDLLWKIVSLPSYGQRWDYSLYVFTLSLLVFVICALVDAVRKRIFSLFDIDEHIAKLDECSVFSKLFT